jgi:hypothetical protein
MVDEWLNLIRIALSELTKSANYIMRHAIIEMNLISATIPDNINHEDIFISAVFVSLTNHLVPDGIQ